MLLVLKFALYQQTNPEAVDMHSKNVELHMLCGTLKLVNQQVNVFERKQRQTLFRSEIKLPLVVKR